MAPLHPTSMKPCLLFALAFVCFWTTAVPTVADEGDWPQWRGPNRDGWAAKQPLLSSWPDGGPALKWQAADIGRGYSTTSIADGMVFTMGSDDDGCDVICLSLADGEPVWKTTVSRASSSDDYNHGWGGGPRSSPTVDGDQVFVLTDVGVVAALEKATGALQWKVDLVATYGGKIPTWGYSESVLVDGDRVIVTPGESNFMVGLDRSTGEKIWQSSGVNAPAQYVSPIKATVGGTTFYVTASKPGLFAFDVASGATLFADDATGNNVAVIPTPIISGNQLYHTSDYGAGNTLLDLSSQGQGSVSVESLYHMSDKTMRNHHGGVVLVDGVIYGFTKANGGMWMAQDLQSGETLWEKKIGRNKSGSIAYADGLLYCYNDKDGSLYLVEPSRDGWNERGMLELPRQTKLPRNQGAIWAHPVIAGGTLFIRDQDLLFAYQIGN